MRPPSAEFKTTGPFGVDTTSDLAEDADLAAILKNNDNGGDYWRRGSQNGVRFEGPLLKKKRRQSHSLGNVGQSDVEHKTALHIKYMRRRQTTETAIPDRKYNHKGLSHKLLNH